MGGPTIRLAVIDDHPAIIDGTVAGLRPLIPGLVLVAAGGSLRVMQRVRPDEVDVVVLDVALRDGSDAAQNVHVLTDAGFRVLLFTQDLRFGLVSRCFRAGAAGIVSKQHEHRVLAEAVRVVATGEPYLSRDWALVLEGDPGWSVPHLAPREVEALRLYATGLPMKLVAKHMGVKMTTAHEYLKRVRLRYLEAGREAPTKSDLHDRAVEDGHLDPEPGPGALTPARVPRERAGNPAGWV